MKKVTLLFVTYPDTIDWIFENVYKTQHNTIRYQFEELNVAITLQSIAIQHCYMFQWNEKTDDTILHQHKENVKSWHKISLQEHDQHMKNYNILRYKRMNCDN